MAINPYTYVNNIYNLKGQYENETDQTKRNTIANNAQQYYQKLRESGYNDVADELQKSNYAQSKAINDKWSTYGKTKVRDYMYTLGQKYGMSQSDVDNLISWNNNTKEISFGGKKIGTPDTIVDGVSYTSDTSIYDDAFNDYITRSGTAIPTQQLIGNNNTGVKEKIDEYWGTIKGDRDKYYSEYDKVSDYVNKDVTKTDEYQSTYKNIMGKYDMSAMQGRDNAIASGSASNGGNIDSYAAANAMRQQTAITAEGQALAHQLGLGAYQARMDNARQLLSDLGVYQKDSHGSMENAIGLQQDEAQRLFENDETAKNNETARLVEQSKVSGLTPTKWTYDQNIYLNSDGTVRDEYLTDDFDATGGFQTIINNAKAKLATATDPEERANLQATIDQARQAKALKTYSSPKYAKWAHEVEAVAPRKTADYDTNLKQIDASVEMTKDTNAAGLKSSELESKTATTVAGINANADMYSANKAAEASKYEVDKASEANKASQESIQKAIDHYNEAQNLFKADDTGPREFIKKYLVPDEKGNVKYTSEDLITLLITESAKYNIDVADARAICDHYGIYTSWLDSYRDRTDDDGTVEVDGKFIDGQYGGMVKK